MTATPESKTRELIWQYPDHEGDPFVLWDEGAKAGCLRFQPEPGESTGELRGQRWRFRYSIRMHPRVTIYRGDSDEIFAEYVPCFTGGGLVSFESGVRYRWKRTDIWGKHWCFRSAGAEIGGVPVAGDRPAEPRRTGHTMLRGGGAARDPGPSAAGLVPADPGFRDAGGRNFSGGMRRAQDPVPMLRCRGNGRHAKVGGAPKQPVGVRARSSVG